MPKPWYSIKAAAQGSDTAEVSILEPISAWYGVSAFSFLTDVRARDEKNVKLYINTPGGDVTEGLAIFNGLRAMGKTVEVHVLGIAASIGSYIAMAADKIVMPKNTMMLLHKPWNGRGGNADEHRAAADQLDTVESLLLPAYQARFKGTDDELRALLVKGDLLTADQCLELGFCDEVVPEIEARAEFDIDQLPEAAQAMFRAGAAAAADREAATARAALGVAALVEQAAKAHSIEAFAGLLAVDETLTTAAAINARAADVAEIAALCRMTGMADGMARDLVAKRAPLAEARTLIAQAQADADAATRVDTARGSSSLRGTQGSTAQAEWSPGSIWNELNKTAA